jgi:hypothetical protein
MNETGGRDAAAAASASSDAAAGASPSTGAREQQQPQELAGPLLAAIRTSRAAAPARTGSGSSSPAHTPQARLLGLLPASHAPRSPGGGSRLGAKPRSPSTPADAAVCRICLEEGALDRPCGCTGTLAHAHQECIQRWINERGSMKCEICEQVGAPPRRAQLGAQPGAAEAGAAARPPRLDACVPVPEQPRAPPGGSAHQRPRAP